MKISWRRIERFGFTHYVHGTIHIQEGYRNARVKAGFGRSAGYRQERYWRIIDCISDSKHITVGDSEGYVLLRDAKAEAVAYLERSEEQ